MVKLIGPMHSDKANGEYGYITLDSWQMHHNAYKKKPGAPFAHSTRVSEKQKPIRQLIAGAVVHWHHLTPDEQWSWKADYQLFNQNILGLVVQKGDWGYQLFVSQYVKLIRFGSAPFRTPDTQYGQTTIDDWWDWQTWYW